MEFTPTIADLHWPDQVRSQASAWYQEVEGSGLSLLLPDGYIGQPDFCTFARDKDKSIHITEDHSMGFTAFRQTIDRELAGLSRHLPQDMTLLYSKNFTFNNYDATALYLYDQHREQTYVYVAFGDQGFHVTMQGSCRADDLDARDAIIRSFLSAGYTAQRG
jgi:hypothetical protein